MTCEVRPLLTCRWFQNEYCRKFWEKGAQKPDAAAKKLEPPIGEVWICMTNCFAYSEEQVVCDGKEMELARGLI